MISLQDLSLYNILIIGFLLPLINDFIHECKRIIYGRVYKTITIKNNNATYTHVQHFIYKNAISLNEMVADGANRIHSANLTDSPTYNFTLAFGKYQIRTKDIFCTVIYADEYISISCYSWKGFRPLQTLLSKASLQYSQTFNDQINVYSMRRYSTLWDCHKSIKKRLWKNIVLDPDIKAAITDDIFTWQKQRSRFEDLGVCYKRCYMFHGPPGVGKSSAVVAIASLLGKDLYNLSLCSSDETWDYFRSVPKNSIIVIEDLDRYFDEIRDKDDKSKIVDWKPSFSLAKLLNALDGIDINDSCIVVLTCNDLYKFPEALIRPGRIDLMLEFKRPDVERCREYVNLAFQRNVNQAKTKTLVDLLLQKQIDLSYAEMQQLLFRFEDIDTAIQAL